MFTESISYEAVTVSTTAVGLTSSKYKDATEFGRNNARAAFISVDGTAGTNDIRFTFDGTTPVGGATPTGHLLQAKQSYLLKGLGNISKFKMIRDGGTDAKVHVTYIGG